MKKYAVLFFLACPLYLLAQKKPLDHTVYDGWQSIGERLVSNDGKWVVYTVTPQEGDADLFIQSTGDTQYKQRIPRGYNALITEDSRFVIFKIKPLFRETREAKIRKKKPEEMPRDSAGIVELGKEAVLKIARVRSFKTPEKTAGWVAFHKEKEPGSAKQTGGATQKTVDSLKKTIDSLVLLVKEIKNIKAGSGDGTDAEEDPSATGAGNEGSELVVRHLLNGSDRTFKNVSDYLFNAYGQKLLMKISRSAKDSLTVNGVVLLDLETGKLDTIARGGNDFRSFALTEKGDKIAFVAERDTARKALQKFYGLYVYRAGDDSANLWIDKNTEGMQLGMTISENGTLDFSKSGNRLFFGTVPLPTPKDTSLVDIDLVKLDIWHYKDDYLQTQQLSRLNNELKRSYLAVYDFRQNKMEQLGSVGLPNIIQTAEGDGDVFLAITDTGRRVEAQWAGSTKKDVYALNLITGARTLVKKNHDGSIYPSSTGKFILLYDNKAKHYFAWDGKGLKNITARIKVPLYDEDYDTPDDPNPYGIMGWHEGDSAVYIYDRYDVWKVDVKGKEAPVNLTRTGRKSKESYRYVRLDRDEKFVKRNQQVYFRTQNQLSKKSGYVYGLLRDTLLLKTLASGEYNFGQLAKAKEGPTVLYTKENYSQSPDLYLKQNPATGSGHTPPGSTGQEKQLSSLNPQQSLYNWGTAELYKWKTFNGKSATGILYKPEDFDSTKKYPMLIYFYEKLSDGLYNYMAPAPTPSRLNIPFFVSRDYVVFAPDISYTRGHPGKDAYNYIVSGAQALGKKKWVDARNIGIQGQSWGGYQVAYLITATDMFKAAWAGAPVVNMFSAYGGIRWESGNNRQVQYEKGQSRIGATPWGRPDLYIENSPFFHLNKVKTPLVIMANDADGAVPWYQGIEFFTALRRLGKKVWMLNYNGEAHNLVERKNRKDIQVREQQYFDWLLKGEKPAAWLINGVPAVKKGKDWGLETVDETE
ncbi:MAG TPA: prolyl oligopeptidase family serine peptidase [Flavisolibacter sp.]|nr:prolyl oligopeptidase family serine peptidase [Flavisolibacter sp.]